MIVAHVGSTGGGAGVAAMKIHRGIRAAGVDSVYFSINLQSSDAREGVRELPRRIPPLGDPRWLPFRAAIKAYSTRRPATAGLFSYPFTPIESPFPFDQVRPDIIHLHWMSQAVDYRTFFGSIPRAQRIVWSLLDMEPITGGCHNAGACRGYETRCGTCPQLNALRNPLDLSAIGFARKRRLYAGRNLTPVAVSRAAADEIRRGRLFARVAPCHVIPVGIDVDAFTPRPAADARRRIGLDPGPALVVGFAAIEMMDRRKGLRTLLDALASLRGRFDLVLLLVGGPLPPEVAPPVRCHHAGYATTPDRLSDLYAAADAWVMPSLQEPLGQVGLEALACGTAVAGSNVGGIPDYVRDGETGVLFAPGDAADLARALASLLERPDARASLGAAGTALVREQFSLDRVIRSYLSLYDRLMAG